MKWIKCYHCDGVGCIKISQEKRKGDPIPTEILEVCFHCNGKGKRLLESRWNRDPSDSDSNSPVLAN